MIKKTVEELKAWADASGWADGRYNIIEPLSLEDIKYFYDFIYGDEK